MKTNKLISILLISTSLASLTPNLTYAVSNIISTNALSQNDKINNVVHAIQNLEYASPLSSPNYVDYVESVTYMFNNLSNDEKATIADRYIEILTIAIETAKKYKDATKFDEEINYLINYPSFMAESKLNELKSLYSTFDNQTRSYVKTYTDSKFSQINDLALSLKPDVYYDFTNAIKNNNSVVNQGKLTDMNAELLGNANLSNNGLSFGTNSKTDGSALKLPSNLFSNANDFTFSIRFRKTRSDMVNENLFTVGTSAYHSSSATSDRMGFRSLFASWYERGPFNMLAYSGDYSKEFGTSAQLYAQKHDLHDFEITVRYISDIKALQYCTKDLSTNRTIYYNYYSSTANMNSNTWIVLDSSNFNVKNFNLNYLGAKDGYSNGAASFSGYIKSFSYYNSLKTCREMYGVDDRNLYIGRLDTLEYINNFGEITNSFLTYKEEYRPIIEHHYKIYMSMPYDYRVKFNPINVAYFLEAYNLLNQN